MEQSNAQGGESKTKQDTFELRHPTPEVLNTELAKLRHQELGHITLMYDRAAVDRQAFFADGHQPPEHGDESY